MAEKKKNYFYAKGRRKTSVATVRLYEKGKGDITVNDKPLKDYLHGTYIGNVLIPLKLTGQRQNFDITIQVNGGGLSSQADAMRHGITRALVEFDPSLRSQLKKEGLLKRDPREKERKKPGLRRARRAPQWAKR